MIKTILESFAGMQLMKTKYLLQELAFYSQPIVQ